jgi:opacity protein-like surface antigen
MKKVVLTATTLLALGVASFAMAGEVEQISAPSHPTGAYIGGAFGWGALSTPSSILSDDVINFFGITNMKNQANGASFRANAGYMLNVNPALALGVEAGYTYLPDSQYSYNFAFSGLNVVTYSDYVIDALAVGKYYVNDQVNLFAKAGAAYVNQKFRQLNVDTDTPNPINSHKWMPEVAVGAGYALTQNIEANITYSHGFGNKNIQSNPSAKVPSFNSVLFGLNYNFNV